MFVCVCVCVCVFVFVCVCVCETACRRRCSDPSLSYVAIYSVIVTLSHINGQNHKENNC